MSNKNKKSKKVSNKRMDKKTKTTLSIVFAILVVFLLFSLYAIRLEISNKNLDKEFDKILEVDVTKGNYNKRIVCVGKYGKAEKALKNYYSDYSNKIQDIIKTINSDDFTSLLSVDTYEDGKVDMEKLVNYSVDTKEDLDKQFKKVLKMGTSEYIEKYADENISDEDARDLFMYYMTLDKTNNYFDKCNEKISNKQKEVDNILDVSRDLFYFLIINKGNWIIKDNKIQFSNSLLMNQYNAYIEKLK